MLLRVPRGARRRLGTGMSNVEINAEVRTDRGKGSARKLRQGGKIPAELYSASQEATALTLDPADVELLRRQPLGWNTPVTLVVDGLAGKHLALIKETQRHPISRQLLHVDFLGIDESRRIEVVVRLLPVGQAMGMEFGGMINQMRRDMPVRCLATNIPESIEIDITELDVGDKLYIDDVVFPEGVEPLYEERFPVLGITVKGARDEDEEEEGEESEEEGAEGEETDAEEASE